MLVTRLVILMGGGKGFLEGRLAGRTTKAPREKIPQRMIFLSGVLALRTSIMRIKVGQIF